MTPYTLAPLAQADLDEIWLFIAKDSVSAADRLLATFRQKFDLLARQPLLGQRRDDLYPNLRAFVAGSYVIYYEPMGKRIRVARVLHGSRDVRPLFEERS